MNLYEILLGQVPEAIYFALFMIFTKQLKHKRTLFAMLMTIEYILLLYVLPYSIWAHILFFILTYIILKVLYMEKAQITDIFTLMIASVILMTISICTSLLFPFSITITITVSRLCMFGFVLGLNYKLHTIQKLYKKLWNRNDKLKKKMKSTTFRAVNLVVFNFMFYIINFCMLYALIFRR